MYTVEYTASVRQGSEPAAEASPGPQLQRVMGAHSAGARICLMTVHSIERVKSGEMEPSGASGWRARPGAVEVDRVLKV
jgi:hypothetical protein